MMYIVIMGYPFTFFFFFFFCFFFFFFFFFLFFFFFFFFFSFFFFFNDTATTEIYTLSLHDALPICATDRSGTVEFDTPNGAASVCRIRSEEHTSELQSRSDLVCRLLLEKKKKKKKKQKNNKKKKQKKKTNKKKKQK